MKNRFLLLALGAATMTVPAVADSDVSQELLDQNTPSGWTAVTLPTIATITESNTFSIVNYGASTSSTDNADAINQAIAAANAAGGGMVVVPAGTWLSGPIAMKSNVVFHLAAGATLQLLPFPGTSTNVLPGSGSAYYPNNGQGADDDGYYDYPVFMSNNEWNGTKYASSTISNVIVEGEGTTSVIDGQGAEWWSNYKSIGTRPSLIRFGSGTNYLFRNFKLLNSPGTNLTLGQSGKASNFTVHDVTISAPSSSASSPSHNTDGIPVWGPYVNIYDCNISTGDDNVVFDTNSQYGHVWNCTFGDGHGASMGSYTANMHDLLWEGITFNGTGAGFRLKSNTGRSGDVYNITMRNCTMTGVQDPIYMTMWYDTHPVPNDATCQADEVSSSSISFHDILLQNITSTGTSYNSSVKHYFPVFIFGRPNTKVYNVTFDNVQVQAQKGMFLAYCEGLTFKNQCTITNSKSASALIADASYDYSYVGNIDGTANATYDDAEGDDSDDDDTSATTSTVSRQNLNGAIYSLTCDGTQSVSVDAGADLELPDYDVNITGGTATLHNGHSSSAAAMISSSGIRVGNSGGSYLLVTLSAGTLRKGDVLTTTGGDGGLVSTTASNEATDNISGNTFTFTDDYAGLSSFYICRGSSKPWMSSITITRQVETRQATTWTFDSWDTQDYTTTTTIDGLTVAATSDNKVAVDASKKTIDGTAYTKRLKLSGTGNESARYVSFDVDGPCQVKVCFAHASSSGDDRTLMASVGSFGTNATAVATVAAGATTTGTYYYDGEGATLYLYSANSGLNLYAIQVTPAQIIVDDEVWTLTSVDGGGYVVPNAIALTDSKTFSAQVPFTASQISYTRTMGNQWGTICLPFAVTASVADNPYDFYTIREAGSDAITFVRIADGTIPAGTPLVVCRNAAEAGIGIAESDAAVVTAPVAGASANGLTLTGTFAATTLASGEGYYIASNKFWQATKSVSIGAYRAYFAGTVASSSTQLRIDVGEGEVSGIDQLSAAPALDDAVCFDLSGRPVCGICPGISLIRLSDGRVRKLFVK